ncbi:HPP family protein [Delftia sp. WSY_9]
MGWNRKAWGPVVPRPAPADMWRVAMGSIVGMGLATALVWLAHAGTWDLPLRLFAPLGATAVLLFAVPTSPLAQPWSCVVGNTVSALWALFVLQWSPPQLAPALAVGGAIGCMLLTRSLHPPGGAMALLTVLNAKASLAAGWMLPFVPVGALTLALVLAATALHRATGRRYPHHADTAPKASPADSAHRHASRLGLSHADLEALLLRFGQENNLEADDLAELLAAAEETAIEHRLGGVRCAQLMTRDPVSCSLDDDVHAVDARFRAHPAKSLPVLDADGGLAGTVSRAELYEWLWMSPVRPAESAAKPSLLNWLGQRLPGKNRAVPLLSELPQLVHAPELSVDEDTPVGQLLNALARHSVPCIPVMREGRLTGLITRTDLMRLLLQPGR